MMRFKLIHSQLHYIGPVLANLYASLEVKSKATFVNDGKKVSKLKPFSTEVKQMVGIEFLLASYLLNEDTDFDAEFEQRVDTILWKSIAFELFEFKRNWLNGFYNTDELLDDVKTLKFDSATFDDVLKVHPELSYLTDINATPSNIEHLKNDLDMDKIFELDAIQQKFVGGSDDKFLEAYREFASATDTSKIVRKLINMDIKASFGSQLFGRSGYGEKMNPYIISFFYDLASKKKMKDLKKYAL